MLPIQKIAGARVTLTTLYQTLCVYIVCMYVCMYVYVCIPYSLDQTPRLLFISSSEFVRRLFESGDYSRAAFINTSSRQRDNPLRNGRLIPLI